MRTLTALAAHLVPVALLHGADAPTGPLSVAATGIGGDEIQLGAYTGKVVLVVNVASRCGFTKQYAQLQSLHETYAKRGLVVLGFPCNQFGGQEPGTEAEILSFCQRTFAVSFPMFGKVDVNGEHAHPLFKILTSQDAPIEDRGPVKWNFEKFLIDRSGKLAARFRSRVSPDAPELVEAIESALGPEPAEPAPVPPPA